MQFLLLANLQRLMQFNDLPVKCDVMASIVNTTNEIECRILPQTRSASRWLFMLAASLWWWMDTHVGV